MPNAEFDWFSATVEDVRACLSDGRLDVNARDKKGVTPLHLAVGQSETPGVVKALLDGGADVNVCDGRDGTGVTPLHWAAGFSKTPGVVEVLLAAGADVNAQDEFGGTPLHWAALASKTPGVIGALLSGGADVNAQDEKGRTPCDLDKQGHLTRLGVC